MKQLTLLLLLGLTSCTNNYKYEMGTDSRVLNKETGEVYFIVPKLNSTGDEIRDEIWKIDVVKGTRQVTKIAGTR